MSLANIMSNDNVFDINSSMKPPLDESNEKTNNDDSYNIIDIRWFQAGRIGMDAGDPIAIVLVENTTMHYVFAVMGIGKDPQRIAAWGEVLSCKMAEGAFGYEMKDYKVR